MTIVNKPDINHGLWAEGGNIEIPSSEKVYEGWVVEKPLNEVMNWVQNRQDKMLQYLNQRGIPEWDFRTEYPVDALTIRGGIVYQAISQNQDADPTLNQSIWKIAFVSYADFVSYAEDVDAIKNQDGFLKLYVQKSNPVMDAPAKGVAYNNSDSTAGLGFDDDSAKITRNGNTVAAFSGGNNPKDVVTHEQLAIAIQNYKVGDIYITTVSEDPKFRLGYGTWQRFGKGRTLVGFTDEVSNDVPTWAKTVESEFGEYEHKLTEAELASHSHQLGISNMTKVSHDSSQESDRPVDATGSMFNNYIGQSGGDQPHNNVQPSIVVYFWKRVS